MIAAMTAMSQPAPLAAQKSATIKIYPERAKDTIPKEIYGHFAEHLGSCIYGGLWVGENSGIPNTQGYRTDVLNALKELEIPVLRWPGGCFADEYHWMDGIGPKDKRPKMVNNNWGGTVEDNSFGTHEFLNLCEMLGCEPYISGNVGSGTVEELAKWVEYMTSDGDSPMANLRRRNGRDKAWKVKYLGVGNESWGCGGDMRPEYYADLYRRYAVYCRNYDGNRLYKVASGASDYDYNWTEVLMKNIGRRMNGLSLHYYTVKGWSGSKGAATAFDKDDYYWTIGKCLEIEDVIRRHCEIMDRYDRNRQTGLLVDEWGTWWDEEPGTVRGHLYQQNSLRDAFVASLTLDVFHKYVPRVRMANIAQIVNVLQSMILTSDRGEMALTPTYHVFNMYKVHQDALCLPFTLICDEMDVRDNRTIPMLSATASRDKNGVIHLSLSNIDADNTQTVSVEIAGLKTPKITNGTILTSANLTDHNTFEKPRTVTPEHFTAASVSNGILQVKIPAKSIIMLELKAREINSMYRFDSMSLTGHRKTIIAYLFRIPK
jgi:alpha-N-arabinofuranosidase